MDTNDMTNLWLSTVAMILAALSPIISAIAAWYASKAVDQGKQNHVAINGRMEQLLKATEALAYTKGVASANQPSGIIIPPQPSDASKSPPRV